jgi:hypothetical protein
MDKVTNFRHSSIENVLKWTGRTFIGRLRPSNPGRRVFVRFCWYLEGVSAPECLQLLSANPGLGIFGHLCWYLERVGATEGVLWPAANPGVRIFRHFCWYLDKVGVRFGAFCDRGSAKLHKLCYFSDKFSLSFGRVSASFLQQITPEGGINHFNAAFVIRLSETVSGQGHCSERFR